MKKISLIVVLFIITPFLSRSQAVFVKDTVKICGSEIYFPLEFQASNCINLTSFYLDINFLSLTIPGTGGPYFWKNPGLIGTLTTQLISPGNLRVHYNGATPVTIPNGSPLFTLSLRYLIGTTNLQLVGAGGILANALLTPSDLSITQQPLSVSAADGYPADFYITTSFDYDINYQWEVSTDNGNSFTSIDSTVPCAGVTSSHLTIDPVDYLMDNFLFRCHITGCGYDYYSDTATLSIMPPAYLYFTLKYNSPLQTPLVNTEIYLKQNGVIVYTVVTDNAGEAVLVALEPETYDVEVNCQYPWGGGNSMDALEIVKHFVGMITLNGLAALAADVDLSGNINSMDALAVMRRFVGLDNSFPAGDWKNDAFSITIQQSANHYLNIKTLCTGDVNGTYLP